MKWLIIGKNGMLGSVFAQNEIALAGETVFMDIDEIDITHFDVVEKVFESEKPQAVINCSAYTNVDGAESDQKNCFEVNVLGVKNLALCCKEWNAVLIHYSTDFIFDGKKSSGYKEDDKPNPLGYYGLSKLEGEKEIRSILAEDNYLIIRTSWLFGPRGNNFVRNILNLAYEKPELQIVDDQRGSPTFTRDLAKATTDLFSRSARGIYHVSNSDNCTWYDFARYVLDEFGLQSYPLKKIGSDDLKRPAKRPESSILNCGKFEKLCGYKMRPWKDAVKDYLKELKISVSSS